MTKKGKDEEETRRGKNEEGGDNEEGEESEGRDLMLYDN